MTRRKILLAVDLQKDFIDGALTVPDAYKVIPIINDIKKNFDLVYFTLDWHPADHCSFKSHGGPWNTHCVHHTAGACLPDSVFEGLKENQIRFILKDSISDRMEYGAFSEITPQIESLFTKDDEVVVCGIAAEYCVLETLKNLFRLSCKIGFTVKVFLKGTARFDSYDTVLAFMKENGIEEY
ncbi:MAG: isochorismatase family protein [Bacteroidales bacterium]|jgi:nicotinamidase/pyrazinamidase|nr:isochorismatase family protein [Bacteroidales bacterium]MDD2204655.1 isochorismatase family protein [Bacteroidales bacterium]MDD3151323.1 isochorismatase family protein [Bacteroidales bacterium]MDD3913670.1 isochorismatase family protein [Bacteroidales bacterium]MDD4633921.1 isochorismatase family protein [Bacteroidales bacterium]